ncbi:MAG: HAMP domain-containing histidine kinase [Deltaproteobacteria bacterium]|nr:HAMP domain-containing histidine kinase [Deltaproteobacteria bacterium]
MHRHHHGHHHRRRRFMRVRRRLWLKVWVALLLTLFASIVFMWTGGRVLSAFGGGDGTDRAPAIAEVVAASLPDDPAAIPEVLQERAEGLGVRLALYDAGGELISTTDPDIPAPSEQDGDRRWMRANDGPWVVAVQLEDGRTLVGGPLRHFNGGGKLHLLLPVGLLAFLALLSMPLARRVTRRLERLQEGVETLGSGDLSARVVIEGTDEVARLASSFNRAAERIEELVKRQQRMLASASHELRSPLARLRMAVDLLSDGETTLSDARRAELMRRAHTDVAELDGLIEDLLLVGRLGAADAEAQRRDRIDLYALTAEEAARFGLEVDGHPAPLDADERALKRMLRNLLENAEKHGGGKEITLSVEPVDGMVRVTVADRGPGVPEGEREQIFTPFHRASDHREGADGGVGLGLALVREIARAHGGDAKYAPREGGGSCFIVDLAAPTTA